MEPNRLIASEVFSDLKLDESNTTCFDCNSFDSNWASLNNGIFLCLNCYPFLGKDIIFCVDFFPEKIRKYFLSAQYFYGCLEYMVI